MSSLVSMELLSDITPSLLVIAGIAVLIAASAIVGLACLVFEIFDREDGL